ncbi:MAG: hypothetical protein K0Q73_8550 [Paenibacillus sp.]|nr:hypothetical protein [Paenibacillus sp.]
MKNIRCDNRDCTEMVEVPSDYEQEFCCTGHMCGCYGYPINPVFCDTCEEKIFGKPIDVSE